MAHSFGINVFKYAFFIASLFVMAFDLGFWSRKLSLLKAFYAVTNACLLFRMFGRSCFVIFLHALMNLGATVFYIHLYLNKIPDNKWKRMYIYRYGWMAAIFPPFFVLSTIVFIILLLKSQTVQRMGTAVHCLLGFLIILIGFWITCFYYYDKTGGLFAQSVYMLFIVTILLTPEMLTSRQTLYLGSSKENT